MWVGGCVGGAWFVWVGGCVVGAWFVWVGLVWNGFEYNIIFIFSSFRNDRPRISW